MNENKTPESAEKYHQKVQKIAWDAADDTADLNLTWWSNRVIFAEKVIEAFRAANLGEPGEITEDMVKRAQRALFEFRHPGKPFDPAYDVYVLAYARVALEAAQVTQPVGITDDAVLRAATVLRESGDSAYLPDVRKALEAAQVAQSELSGNTGQLPSEPTSIPGEMPSEPECKCSGYSEDRGGGYFEHMLDPEPDCPEHGELISAPPAPVGYPEQNDREKLIDAMRRGERVREAAWLAYGQEPDGEGTPPMSDNWYRAEALLASGFASPHRAINEGALIRALNEILSDLSTGPLSDTPFTESEVNRDDQLELWNDTEDTFPDGVIDTPQLARAVREYMESKP